MIYNVFVNNKSVRTCYFFAIISLVKFSRRTAKQLANWAARRGYQAQPADILDDAKKKRYERYTCVNIAPSDTVEIRIFRGTLKFNTFIAVLEMVDRVCQVKCVSFLLNFVRPQ